MASASTTQIIATIGPASASEEVLSAMMAHHMDVARLNLSWGTHEEHAGYIELIRKEATRYGKEVPIIADLSGPRVQEGGEHHYVGTADAVLTEKDRNDIVFGVKHDVEYFALSYVGNVGDVRDLRKAIELAGGRAKVIAKIERKEALENITEILEEADGIMIARGDLGETMPIERIPFIQRNLIKLAHEVDKPVAVATEMLPSMIDEPEPTRSDVTDVAYAVTMGASAVMLSGETAVGKYPVETIKVMERIVVEAEREGAIIAHELL